MKRKKTKASVRIPRYMTDFIRSAGYPAGTIRAVAAVVYEPLKEVMDGAKSAKDIGRILDAAKPKLLPAIRKIMKARGIEMKDNKGRKK